MATAAVAYDNLVDATAAVLSTSAASLALAPVTNLTNPHVGKKWRINATTVGIIVDLGSSLPVDTVMLAGVSGTAPTFRVRLSSADATGVAGNIFDSGSLTGLPYWDYRHRLFVYLRTTPLSGRYLRIDVTEAAVSYIEAGRMFGGIRKTFETNLQTPWIRSQVNRSVTVEGVGGQSFIDLRQGYFRQQASFSFVTEAERIDFIEEIATRQSNWGHLDMLWVKDPDSTNLSRDSLWGYVDGEFTVSQQIYIVPPLYTVDFPMRGRL